MTSNNIFIATPLTLSPLSIERSPSHIKAAPDASSQTRVEGLIALTACHDQSQTELASIVQTYSPILFRVAYSILRSKSEAEDVLQDLFVRVLKHRHSLDALENKRVWLVRIAWNLALDRKRRIRPDQIDAVFAESLVARNAPADHVVQHAQQMTLVLQEMERLPKAERHILLLSAIEELSTAEMAEVLGKSESAVRALLFRARTRIRDRMTKRLQKNSGGRP